MWMEARIIVNLVYIFLCDWASIVCRTITLTHTHTHGGHHFCSDFNWIVRAPLSMNDTYLLILGMFFDWFSVCLSVHSFVRSFFALFVSQSVRRMQPCILSFRWWSIWLFHWMCAHKKAERLWFARFFFSCTVQRSFCEFFFCRFSSLPSGNTLAIARTHTTLPSLSL